MNWILLILKISVDVLHVIWLSIIRSVLIFLAKVFSYVLKNTVWLKESGSCSFFSLQYQRALILIEFVIIRPIYNAEHKLYLKCFIMSKTLLSYWALIHTNWFLSFWIILILHKNYKHRKMVYLFLADFSEERYLLINPFTA